MSRTRRLVAANIADAAGTGAHFSGLSLFLIARPEVGAGRVGLVFFALGCFCNSLAFLYSSRYRKHSTSKLYFQLSLIRSASYGLICIFPSVFPMVAACLLVGLLADRMSLPLLNVLLVDGLGGSSPVLKDRSIRNVSLGFGALCSVPLVTRGLFTYCFLFNATLTVVSGVLVATCNQRVSSEPESRAPVTVTLDRKFEFKFTLWMTMMYSHVTLLGVSIPIVVDHRKLPGAAVNWVVAANNAGAVILQVLLIKCKRFDRTLRAEEFLFRAVGILVGLTFFVLAMSSKVDVGALYTVGAICVIATVAEVFQTAFLSQLVSQMSDHQARKRLATLNVLAVGVSTTLLPPAIGFVTSRIDSEFSFALLLSVGLLSLGAVVKSAISDRPTRIMGLP